MTLCVCVCVDMYFVFLYVHVCVCTQLSCDVCGRIVLDNLIDYL